MRSKVFAPFLAALLLIHAAPALAADAGGKVDAAAPAWRMDAGAGAAVPVPPDVKGALKHAKATYAAAKGGQWWYFAALLISLIIFLLKFIGIKQGFWPKLGRWRYIIPPALSLIAALLAAFQGGVTFEAAAAVFTSSWVMASAQEAWEHGVLNKPRASAGGQT